MTRVVFILMFAVGIGLAWFALNTTMGEFSKYEAQIAAQQQEIEQQKELIVPTQEVFVAVRQLSYGQELRPSDLRPVQWPTQFLPQGSFASLDDIFPADIDGTRTVLRTIERNEPIIPAKVTNPGQGAGMASSLTRGMRAFTLQVNNTSGVSGFLRPGDRVDVYWTGAGTDQQSITRLIHPNLQLIAVDQETDEEDKGPVQAQTVTIEAPPFVIAKLAHARSTGRISMALVGIQDDTAAEQVEVALEDVVDARQNETKSCSIRTRRGAEVVLVEIPCNES